MKGYAFLLIIFVYLLPGILFYLSIATAIVWAVERGKPEKPVFMGDHEHIYYPYRHSKKCKVMTVIVAIGWTIFLTFVAYGVHSVGEMSTPIIIIFSIIALILLVCIYAAIRFPLRSQVECLIFNRNGLVLHFRNGEEEFRPLNRFEGYSFTNRAGDVQLSFRGEDGKTENVYLLFLPRKLAFEAAKDLTSIKQRGFPVVQYVSPTSAPAASSSPAPGSTATAPAAKSQAAHIPVIPRADSIKTSEEAKKLMQEMAEAKQALWNDPVRYDAYLKTEAATVPSEKKERWLELLSRSEKIQAIKECREYTGLGLREAKDLVEYIEKKQGAATAIPEPAAKAAPGGEEISTPVDVPTDGEWRFVTSGVQGNAYVFGVNIFDYQWIDTGSKVKVKDPSYGQEFTFPVYLVHIKDDMHLFAAGEVSNLVYAFFVREK